MFLNLLFEFWTAESAAVFNLLILHALWM